MAEIPDFDATSALWDEIRSIKKALNDIQTSVVKAIGPPPRRGRQLDSIPGWAQAVNDGLSQIDAKVEALSRRLLSNDDSVSQRLAQSAVSSSELPVSDDATVAISRKSLRSERSSQMPLASRKRRTQLPASPVSLPVNPRMIWTDYFRRTTLDSEEKVITMISQIVRHAQFSGKVSVSNPELEQVSHVNLDQNLYFRNVIRPGHVTGTCHVRINTRKAPIKWPDTSAPSPRPDDEEAEADLDHFVSNPPTNVHYYGGCSTEAEVAILSALGRTLPDDTLHANIPYYHVGERLSGTPFHKEDANFWSCNIVEFGWKLWILIRDTPKFEDFVRRNWQAGSCDNFVRHLDLMISPSKLREEGISFNLHVTGPGEMIITKPGTYHEVLNLSPCIARSVNFIMPSEPVIPEHFEVCRECGLYPWKSKDGVREVPTPPERSFIAASSGGSGGHKRKSSGQLQRPARKTERRPEFEAALKEIRHIDPDCVPTYETSRPPSAGALMLAAAVKINVTEAYIQSLEKEISVYRAEFISSDDDRLSRCLQVLKDASCKCRLGKMRLKVAELALIQEAKNGMPGHLKNVPAKFRDDICQRYGWDKRQLTYHLDRGKAWYRLCGSYGTLLCFLPEKGNRFGIPLKQYRELSGNVLDEFHALLSDEHTRRIFSLACNVQNDLLYLHE